MTEERDEQKARADRAAEENMASWEELSEAKDRIAALEKVVAAADAMRRDDSGLTRHAYDVCRAALDTPQQQYATGHCPHHGHNLCGCTREEREAFRNPRDGWLQRSLERVAEDARDWPAWKRQAGDAEPCIAIPGPARPGQPAAFRYMPREQEQKAASEVARLRAELAKLRADVTTLAQAVLSGQAKDARAEEPKAQCTRCNGRGFTWSHGEEKPDGSIFYIGREPWRIPCGCCAEEPEQAARGRLGRFLATHEGSYFEEPETSDSERPFRVALASVYMSDEHEDAFDPIDVNGVTRGEAINAALDRAEGKEPT